MTAASAGAVSNKGLCNRLNENQLTHVLSFLEVDELVDRVEPTNKQLSRLVRTYLCFPDEGSGLKSDRVTAFLTKTFQIARVHAKYVQPSLAHVEGVSFTRQRFIHLGIYINERLKNVYHFPENEENIDKLEKALERPRPPLQKTWALVRAIFQEIFTFPCYMGDQVFIPEYISGADFHSYFKGKFCKFFDEESQTTKICKILVAKELAPTFLTFYAEPLSAPSPAEERRAFNLNAALCIIVSAAQKALQNLAKMEYFHAMPTEGGVSFAYIPSAASENEEAALVRILEKPLLRSIALAEVETTKNQDEET